MSDEDNYVVFDFNEENRKDMLLLTILEGYSAEHGKNYGKTVNNVSVIVHNAMKVNSKRQEYLINQKGIYAIE